MNSNVAPFVQLQRRLVDPPHVADAQGDGDLLVRGDHDLLGVRLVALAHPHELVQPRRQARNRQRPVSGNGPDELSVDVEIHVVHVGFDDGRSQQGRRFRIGPPEADRADAEQHGGVVVAPRRRRLGELSVSGVPPNVGPHVLDHLVGRDPPVAGIVVGVPPPGLGQEVGEEPEPGREALVLMAHLPLAGRGQGQEALGQVAVLLVERLVRRLCVDLAGVARVGQQHLPVGLHAVRHDVAEHRHGIGRLLQPPRVDVRRGQVSPSVLHEPVPGEVDDHAVGRRRHRGQPFLERIPDVGQRRLRTRQQPHVLGWKRTAHVADEHAVHRLGVALREQQLPGLVEVAVLADADDEGVAARHCRELHGLLIGSLEDQIPAARPVLLGLPCRGQAGGAPGRCEQRRTEDHRGVRDECSRKQRVHSMPPDNRAILPWPLRLPDTGGAHRTLAVAGMRENQCRPHRRPAALSSIAAQR